MTTTSMRRFAVLLVAAVAALSAGTPVIGATAAPTHHTAAAVHRTLIGAASRDWPWFDRAVGPVQIYRDFDEGFHYATWHATAAYQAHPHAHANDYSFDVLPQRLTNPTDPINAKIRAFLATTPKNIIITNYHEPDNVYLGKFTPAQFRAGTVAFARMVHTQNALDGGHRMTSVVLMGLTVSGAGTTQPGVWWPTDARDGGHVDIFEVDVYAYPHNTGTRGVPRGYTDGLNWRTVSSMLDPTRAFAAAHKTRWAVAEIGFLVDIHSPKHKPQSMAEAVAFATTHGAHHISYFDCTGPRADWRLRWAFPPGTTSSTSNPVLRWKALVAHAGGA